MYNFDFDDTIIYSETMKMFEFYNICNIYNKIRIDFII